LPFVYFALQTGFSSYLVSRSVLAGMEGTGLGPPEVKAFSVTFDAQVSPKDVVSLLSFLQRRAVEEGGVGLRLLSKTKEGR
jgi:hypothetical protein